MFGLRYASRSYWLRPATDEHRINHAPPTMRGDIAVGAGRGGMAGRGKVGLDRPDLLALRWGGRERTDRPRGQQVVLYRARRDVRTKPGRLGARRRRRHSDWRRYGGVP